MKCDRRSLDADAMEHEAARSRSPKNFQDSGVLHAAGPSHVERLAKQIPERQPCEQRLGNNVSARPIARNACDVFFKTHRVADAASAAGARARSAATWRNEAVGSTAR